MPKRTDLETILIIGSGPIVILGGKGAQPAFGEAIRTVESNGLLSGQA